MEHEEIMFHLESLREWDEIDLLDAMHLTSEDLVDCFQEEAIAFIKENWG